MIGRDAGAAFEEPESFAFTRDDETRRGAYRQIPARAPGECGLAVARSGAAAGGRLVAASGDGLRGAAVGYGADPGVQGRDLLHDVQPAAGRALSAASLHHDPVLAARLRRR